MRYPVSGSNSSAIEPATGVVQSLLGRNIPTGRTFWLRGLWYGSSGTQGDLLLYDATAGAALAATSLKCRLPAWLTATGGLEAGHRQFPPPGLQFRSGCCVALAASGTIGVGAAGACGYEEG